MSENPFEVSQAGPIPLLKPVSWGRWAVRLLVYPAIIAVVVVMLAPVTRNARPAAHRTQCKNNLKQIAFALHNYHEDYETFPPAFTVDDNGRRLHSWRTLILPYLEQQQLYDSIDLSKPWDDPVNVKAAATAVSEYACPSAGIDPGKTNYVAIVGDGTCFPGSRPRAIKEITDGTSNTLLVTEVSINHAVPWMSPDDVDESVIRSINSDSKLAHAGGFQAALVDGSVRFISTDTSADVRRALISAAAGDKVGEF